MGDFRFNPAARAEKLVYGSERPGYPEGSVGHDLVVDWIQFMKDKGINRVCCLLEEAQLDMFDEDLLEIYRQKFGHDNLCWAPVKDFHLSDVSNLTEVILPFLMATDFRQERVVVHCAGGLGRTGHVLAAWLVHGRRYGVEQALAEVKNMGRNPYEAIEAGNANIEQLCELLRSCRQNGSKDRADGSQVSI